MGCDLSVEREKNNQTKDKFSDFEQILGFHTMHSKYIEGTFRRFSNEANLDSVRFAKAFEVLKLNPQTHKEFYNLFKLSSLSHHYSLNRLSALAVLLGEADDFERAKILFMAYDDSSNESLESSEVYNMISEIVNISLDYIPKLAVMLSPNDKALAFEASELVKNKIQVIHHLSSKFELAGEVLTYERYLMVFKDDEVSKILRPYELRNLAFKMMKASKKLNKCSTMHIKSSFH